MNAIEAKAFLNLMMCSDPWPTSEPKENKILEGWAEKIAKVFGHDSWIETYHMANRKTTDFMGFEAIEVKNSSNILIVGYNEQLKQLIVKMGNEATYIYKDVPEDEFVTMTMVKSLGTYFNKFKGKYRYEKVE